MYFHIVLSNIHVRVFVQVSSARSSRRVFAEDSRNFFVPCDFSSDRQGNVCCHATRSFCASSAKRKRNNATEGDHATQNNAEKKRLETPHRKVGKVYEIT